MVRMLMTRMFDEARRYHLAEIKLHGFDDEPWLEHAARPGGIEVVPGTPTLLRMEAAAAA
jgi:hypothetical protein